MDRTCYEPEAAVQIPSFSERLKQKTLDILDTHEPEPLPDNVEDEISRITRKWIDQDQ